MIKKVEYWSGVNENEAEKIRRKTEEFRKWRLENKV